MSVVIVYGSGMFCDNQCQDDNGAGIIADVQIKWQNLYGKKLYFSSADDEGTGITCTYTKGKNGFKLERSKMVLTERSGRYAVGYICMIVYTIL